MKEPITVVALGPDNIDTLTLGAVRALEGAGTLLLRTERHGAAAWLRERQKLFRSLDALYEAAEDFDALNAAAVQAIREAWDAGGALVYAVPDPATDATVALLAGQGVPLRIMPGVSQADVALGAAIEAGLPAEGALCRVAGADLASHRIDPAQNLLITEVTSRLMAGEIKLQLLDLYPPEMTVLLESLPVPLEEIDRQGNYTHLSTVYIPKVSMMERARYAFGDLLDVMARLRQPVSGCPWDIEQTHESLRRYVIEEAYELVEAIDSGDMDRVADELGDVLLQVVFHAQVAKEHGDFGITDVTTAICHKMITRHAHIFGDIVCETAEDVLKSWETIKKGEKGLATQADVMRDVPGHLPALMRAGKVQAKAHQVGFDWKSASDALEKVREETQELAAELSSGSDPTGELGDLLFAAVNVARLAGIEPELALGNATTKFIARFAAMERAILGEGKQLGAMTLEEMDTYWDAVKRAEAE